MVSWRHRQASDDAVACVQGLIRKIVRPSELAGTVQMTGLRIGTAYPLVIVLVVFFTCPVRFTLWLILYCNRI